MLFFILWKMSWSAEAAGGWDLPELCRMRRPLCGRHKAPREWLEFFGTVLEEHVDLLRGKSAPHLFAVITGM